MGGRKTEYKEDEIAIFEDACVYKRGDYWQFRLWLEKEKKYVRKSLRTRKRTEAVELGKELYLELFADMKQGKSYYSITSEKAAEKYLAARKHDCEMGLIAASRYTTLKSHLKHWVAFIDKNTKVRDLKRKDCEGYYEWRLAQAEGDVKQKTVHGEQATINGMMKWLYRQNETYIDGFDFKKLKRIDDAGESVRRQTLTSEEYNRLIRTMRKLSPNTNNELKDLQSKWFKLTQMFVLIATNSGLRVGEQKQLRWEDVRVEEHKDKEGNTVKLARINVRAATSKVRKARTLLCRNGQYFERLKMSLGERTGKSLVFSIDGKREVNLKTLSKYFKTMLEAAEIEDAAGRGIVLYSLRHFMITQRIMAGLSYRQVADMCGTSVMMIEKTYWHLNDEIRLTSALADYRRREDGTIEVI